jgi:hypothetical protein
MHVGPTLQRPQLYELLYTTRIVGTLLYVISICLPIRLIVLSAAC